MLTPNILRTAIVLCLRAPLKGEEARETVAALDALQEVYDTMTAPPPEPEKKPRGKRGRRGKPKEETNGDDAQPSK